LCAAAPNTHAFGSDGHRIAALIAEPYLCAAATVEIDRLGNGDYLTELGLWADRIRTLPPWNDSGPWHYMNIADGDLLENYRSPPEGDILWAIANFRSRLEDTGLARERRGEALRFLVHFVVDLHQPLHVGRDTDRGGNTIEVFLDRKRITLHRFWDTEAIGADALPVERFLRNAMPTVRRLAAGHRSSPARQWAAESLALRDVVYAFDAETRQLDENYLEIAADVVQKRLIQAGIRLADELNSAFCPESASLSP
jgi:hypothetical protein